MHPFDIIILISIACCVGLSFVIYVKRDLALAAGYIAGSIIGSFGGSFLLQWWLPDSQKIGVVLGGIGGAVLLVLLWHFIRRNKPLGRF